MIAAYYQLSLSASLAALAGTGLAMAGIFLVVHWLVKQIGNGRP